MRYVMGILALALVLLIAACENEAECRKDGECWGEKHVQDAALACAPDIEAQARYDHDWTDSLFERKFSRWFWDNIPASIMRYDGNKIKFQNGFGAWQQMGYSCYYNTDTKSVVRVEVR